MDIVYETNVLSQVGTSITGQNRKEAPVVGAGSTDFWGSQRHYTVDGIVKKDDQLLQVNHFTSTVFKTPNEDQAKKWNKEFSSLEKQIDTLIAFMTPKGNIHKEVKKMADGLERTCNRLKRLDGELLKITNTPKKTAEQ